MAKLTVTNIEGKPVGTVDFHESFLRDVAAVNAREGVSVKLWPILDKQANAVVGFTVNFEAALPVQS